MSDIERYETYKVLVKLRPTWRGQPLKQRVAELQGQTITVEAGWLMDEDDQYPGEWAMLVSEEVIDKYHISWIASGDLEILNKVERP